MLNQILPTNQYRNYSRAIWDSFETSPTGWQVAEDPDYLQYRVHQVVTPAKPQGIILGRSAMLFQWPLLSTAQFLPVWAARPIHWHWSPFKITEFNQLKQVNGDTSCHVFESVSYHIFQTKCRLLIHSQGTPYCRTSIFRLPFWNSQKKHEDFNTYLCCQQLEPRAESLSGMHSVEGATSFKWNIMLCTALFVPSTGYLEPTKLISHHQIKGLIQHKEAVSTF